MSRQLVAALAALAVCAVLLPARIKVRVRSLTKEQTWVPLFSGDVGVVSAQASGGGLFGADPLPMRSGKTIGLMLPGKGRYSVELEVATPIVREQQSSSALVPTVAALGGSYEVTLEGANAEVWTVPDVPLQTRSEAGKTVVQLYGGAGGPVQIHWQPRPEVREVEALAFAEQTMLLAISPGLLRVETEIAYTLLQGQMAEAAVELPEGYSLLKVEGDNLRTWDIGRQDDGPDRLAVGLLDPARPSTSLKLVLERTLDAVPVEVDAPHRH